MLHRTGPLFGVVWAIGVSAVVPVVMAQVPATPPGEPLHLTLGKAKALALTNNSALGLARLNLDEKRFATNAARKDYFPKLLGSLYYFRFNDDLGTVIATRGRSLGGAAIGPGGGIQLPTISTPGRTVTANVVNRDSLVGTLLVAQPLTKLVAINALVDIAQAEEAIAAAQLDQGTRQVLSGVAQAYFGVLTAQRVESILALQLRAIEPMAQGDAPAKARLAVLEVRKALAQARAQVADLTDQFLQLLGLPPGTRVVLEHPKLPPVPVQTADEAAQLAVVNNPQIREAEQNIAKAHAAVRIAKMDYLPDVNLMAMYTGQTFADYIQEDFSAIGIIGSYTFFDWGKRRQVLFQRKAQVALAAQNVQNVTETVQLAARRAFHAYRQAADELEIARATVAAYRQAEQEASGPEAIAQGKAATAKAELDLIQAEITYRLAQIKLMEILGQP